MTDADIDVVLSFTGADRVIVEEVGRALRDLGVRVVYDQIETVDLLGRDPAVFLKDLSHQRTRSAAVFISRHYVRRIQTAVEPELLQARMCGQRPHHLIPIHLDGTKLPGVPPSTGDVDAREHTGQEVANLIGARVEHRSAPAPEPRAPAGIPMTVHAKVQLVSFRPPGWEYLLLAGAIWPAAQALEAQRMDLELTYAARTGEHVPVAQLAGRIGVWLDELGAITASLSALVEPARLAWALGRPGEPGEPIRIEHVGRRFAQRYGELLDWHRRVAGAATERDALPILTRLARLAERPVQQTRAFVDDITDAALAIAESYEEHVPVTAVPVSLALGLDDELLDELLSTLANRP